ncbi:MAG: DUF370 domain-containing protein [Clostridia bacterium]|nr:DUF370 domain-containing protein [Clostridia bacterium]
MYIHIGNGKTVRKCDIEAILDLDGATVSVYTRRYLSNAQKEGRVEIFGLDIPRSLVLMRDKKIYLSALTVSTITS